MNGLVEATSAWLLDFYLAATLLLCLALITEKLVKQPVRRLSIARAVTTGLSVLVPASALPFWPRISLVSHPFVSFEQPSSQAAEQAPRTRPIVETPADAVWDARDGAETFPVQFAKANPGGPTRSIQLSPHAGASVSASDSFRISRTSIARLFLGLFAAGTVVNLVWLAAGAVQTNVLCRSARVAPREFLTELRALVGQARWMPRLLISSRVRNALAVGLIRPTILLPERMAREGISPGVRAALAHEWTHIRNKDMRLMAVCRALRLILFFHPLFWLLRRSIQANQEAVADAAAADVVGPLVYAEALLGWARDANGGQDTHLAPVLAVWERPSPSQLTRRMAMVLDRRICFERRVSRGWAVGSAVLFLAAAAGFSRFTVRPAAAIPLSDRASGEVQRQVRAEFDQFGDLLPPKAVLRLGTQRLRERGRPSSIAFSPDGKIIATFGDPQIQAVSLWDVRSGRLIQRLRGRDWPLATAGTVLFSPDGSRCLAGDFEGSFHIWGVPSGKKLVAFQKKSPPGRRVTFSEFVCAVFSPDGSRFAGGGSDGFVRVWRADDGHELSAFDTGEQSGLPRSGIPSRESMGARGPVSLAFSPDGRVLVTGTEGAKVHVLDLETGRLDLRIEKAHDGGLTTVAITPDGERLLTGGFHFETVTESVPGLRGATAVRHHKRFAEIRVWDLASGRKLRELDYGQPVAGLGAIRLSDDGTTLASSSFHAIHIWDIRSGETLRTIPTPGPHFETDGFALSPDGRIVARSRFHTVDFWVVATGRPLLPEAGSHASTIGDVTYSPDGSLIATGGDDGTVGIWESKTGRRVCQYCTIDPLSMFLDTQIPMLVAFSPDGKILAVGGRDGPWPCQSIITLYDTPNGEPIVDLSNPVAPYTRLSVLAFKPDGKQLAVAGEILRHVDEIDIWNLESGMKAAELRPPPYPRDLIAMAYLDDRTLCEVRRQPPIIRIWDTFAGNLKREIEVEGHWANLERRLQEISAAVFSPDRRHVITCGEDKLMQWDLETGAGVSTILLDGRAEDHRIAISPDGRLLAVSYFGRFFVGGDDAIRLWDLATGEQVLSLEPADTRAASLAFSPDGRQLVTGMDNGTALVWDVSSAYKPLPR